MARVMQFQFNPDAKPNEGGGGSSRMVPEGEHDLKILALEDKPAGPNSDWGQIEIGFEVVGSPDATAIGITRKKWHSMSPNSTPYFLRPMLEAAGVHVEDHTIDTPNGPAKVLRFDADEAIGAVVKGKCKHETYNGKTRERWSDYRVSDLNPKLAGNPSSPAMQPMPTPASARAAMPGPLAGLGNPPPATARRFG